MKRLSRIICVLLLGLIIPKTDALANELAPYNSDIGVSFYGEYKPNNVPGTSEPWEPTTVPTAAPTAVPTIIPTTEPQKITPAEPIITPTVAPQMDEPKSNNLETNVPAIPPSLPQTGDGSNLPYVYGGLVILVSCIMIPKSKMQYALQRH
jgi:LPXTG-motif cell wall-anchored protein